MLLVVLIGLIVFFSLFGTPMVNVFLKNIEYTYSPFYYEGDYLVTGKEWDIEEEVEERQKTLRFFQNSYLPYDGEEDFVQERFGKEAESEEEHY